jgi:hypothetical protein
MEYLDLPLWAKYLLQGILAFVEISAAAVLLSRAGRSPYLAFLIILPYVQIAALWVFAFTVWPKLSSPIRPRKES